MLSFFMQGGVYPFKSVLCDAIDTPKNDRFWGMFPPTSFPLALAQLFVLELMPKSMYHKGLDYRR